MGGAGVMLVRLGRKSCCGRCQGKKNQNIHSKSGCPGCPDSVKYFELYTKMFVELNTDAISCSFIA